MSTSQDSFGLVKPDQLLDVKIEQFVAFTRELQARLTDNVPLQMVIDSEVVKVLEKTVEAIGKADPTKIQRAWKYKEWTTLEGRKYKLSWHMRDITWNAIVEKRNANVLRRMQARGATAKSWYLLAQKIGGEIKAPAYVKAALPRNGVDMSADVSIERSGQNGNYGLGITNSMPVLRFDPPGGLAAFFTGLAGRMGYYKNNVARGVFNSIDTVAKKYPGIELKEVA